MLRNIWPKLPRSARMAVMGVPVAVGVFGVSFWSSNAELHSISGARPERVTAISIEQRTAADCPVSKTQTIPGWDITWRSEDPPKGQPAVFVERDSCGKASVGDHATIERGVAGDGSLQVTRLVAGNERSALEIAGGLGAAAGMIAAFSYRSSDKWKQRRLSYLSAERHDPEGV